MMDWPQPLRGVLFDLDGTLLDSAPDLYAALAAQCAEEGVPAPAFAAVREVVSRGARAMLRVAFVHDEPAAIEARVPRFLALYAEALATHTRIFDGVDTVLAALEARGIAWGVVTNKPEWLARPLLEHLGLASRAACIVGGDTLAVKKPDPAPVLHACELIGLTPAQCVYVGDDARDVIAGHGAGMPAVAVSWGYLDGGDPHSWNAEAVVDTPQALLALLQTEVAA
ncbi:phosphoglycolate phosphatase [Oleiagrimonas sp. C23AA]|uniref:phosphoglycolate phosphatase n=1 Tax=Oleiagrimonas sp. C23AA TaxID=2719047 RepID=UPI001423CE9B|nr:phosphoglycolate phosphatase [Oleiagrimonas sp. C23AA]NII10215.1 phosphoglycolate phosphatase [Oleiagrimonas sp. C23AA]